MAGYTYSKTLQPTVQKGNTISLRAQCTF